MISFRYIFVVGDVFSQKAMRINKNNLRSQSTLKIEIFKSNFFLVHGVPIRLK